MSVTVVNLREHVETDLVDTALQRLINDAQGLVDDKAGNLSGNLTEEYFGNIRRFWTRQRINAIVSLREGPTLRPADLVDVPVTDFVVIYEGKAVERLDTEFDERIQIVYTPEILSVPQRDRVVIDLVKLALRFDGLQSEKVGDWSGSLNGYQEERDKILASLFSAGRMRMMA